MWLADEKKSFFVQTTNIISSQSILDKRGPWLVCELYGKQGVILDNTMIIPPLYPTIKLEPWIGDATMAYIETCSSWFEALLDTFDGSGFFVRELMDGRSLYLYITLGGRIVLRFDEAWEKEQSSLGLYNEQWFQKVGLKLPICPPKFEGFRIVRGFVDGIALAEVNDDGYSLVRLEINTSGVIINSYDMCYREYEDILVDDVLNERNDDGFFVDEYEELYRDAFEDDPGSEWNID